MSDDKKSDNTPDLEGELDRLQERLPHHASRLMQKVRSPSAARYRIPGRDCADGSRTFRFGRIADRLVVVGWSNVLDRDCHRHADDVPDPPHL